MQAGRGDVTGSCDVSLLLLIAYNLTTLPSYSEQALSSQRCTSALGPAGSVAWTSRCLQDHIAKLWLVHTSSPGNSSAVSQKTKLALETIYSHRISLGAVPGPYDDTPTSCATNCQNFGWSNTQVMTLVIKKFLKTIFRRKCDLSLETIVHAYFS